MVSIRDTFLLTLVLLLISHIPILWVDATDSGRQWLASHREAWKKNWEKTDYFWLILSLVAVLSIAGDASRLLKQNQLTTSIQYSNFARDRHYIAGSLDLLSQWPGEPGYDEARRWLLDAEEVAVAGNQQIATAQALFSDGKGE
jgi:hypothetical protein